jgi:hypothetical protein
MSLVVPPGTDGAAVPRNAALEQVISLLKQAIDLLDAQSAPPELAACVQEGLDRVTAFASA